MLKSPRRTLGIACLLMSLPCAAFCQSANRFVFSDGTSATCKSYAGMVTQQVYLPAMAAVFTVGDYTGVTIALPDGSARITWNSTKLGSLPAGVHDFVYFHECAHAHVPTSDELIANCTGLVDMRKAGRSSPAVEAQLRQFHTSLGYMGPRYGVGSSYWAKTVSCANAGSPEAPAQSDFSTTTTCRFTYGPQSGRTIDFGSQPGVTPALVGAQCTDGRGSFGVAVASESPAFPSPSGSPIVGKWRGVLNGAAGSLTLVFHFLPGGNGTVDSVTQGAFGLPMQYRVQGDRVSASIPSVGAGFFATVNGDRLTGTFAQGGNLPLSLSRQ